MSDFNCALKTCRIANHNDLLYKARWPKLSIYAQRLLIFLMRQVRKDDDDFMTYRIIIQHLCRVLGTNNHDVYERFNKATDELMKKLIRWENPIAGDLEKTAWCCYAKFAKKKGYVDLRFDKSLKPFFIAFNDHFTTYDFWSAIRLNNHYNLRLYQLIKYHQGIARWLAKEKGPQYSYTSKEFDIDWLRDFIGIEEGQYVRYCHLDLRIFKPAIKEFRNKTDVRITVKPKMEDRKITKVIITWRNNPYNRREEVLKDNEYVNSATFQRVLTFGLTASEAKRIYTIHRKDVETDQEFISGLSEKLDDISKRDYVGNITGYAKQCLLEPQRTIFKPQIQRDKEEKIKEWAKKKEELEKQRQLVTELENEFLKDQQKDHIDNDQEFIEFCRTKGYQIAKEKEIIGFTNDGQIILNRDQTEWSFKDTKFIIQ